MLFEDLLVAQQTLARLDEDLPHGEKRLEPYGHTSRKSYYNVRVSITGKFLEVQTLSTESRKKIYPGKALSLPDAGRSSNILCYVTSDTTDYVFGGPGRAALKHSAFLASWTELRETFPKDTAVQAVGAFIETAGALAKIRELCPPIGAIEAPRITFSVEDGPYLSDLSHLQKWWGGKVLEHEQTKGTWGVCRITGKKAFLPDVHQAEVRLAGSNGKLVTANAGSMQRWGSTGAAQSGMGQETVVACTQGLKYLASNPKNHVQHRGTSLLLFVPQNPTEYSFQVLFDGWQEDQAEAARASELFKAPYYGIAPTQVPENDLIVASFTANRARLISESYECTALPEVVSNVRDWVGLLDQPTPGGDHITAPFKPSGIGYLVHVLGITGRKKADEDLAKYHPDAVGQLFRRALYGEPISGALQQVLVDRLIREEPGRSKNDKYTRRRYLARLGLVAIFLNDMGYDVNVNVNPGTGVRTGLNPKQVDEAYLRGRLFAVLESIYQLAIGGPSELSKYIGGAALQPQGVLAWRFEMALQAHLPKLRRDFPFKARQLKAYMDEITDLMQEPFPQMCDHKDRLMFLLGRQHQATEMRFAKNISYRYYEEVIKPLVDKSTADKATLKEEIRVLRAKKQAQVDALLCFHTQARLTQL